MAYGTAPRKVNGVWVTRRGRRLSAAGQRYWENQHAQGRTDARGHMTSGIGATAQAKTTPAKPKPKPKPSTPLEPVKYVKAHPKKHGSPFGGIVGAAKGVAHAAAGGVEELLPGSQWGAGGHKTKHGLGRSTSQVQEKSARALKDVGNLTLGPDATAALTGGKASKAGLAVDLALAPFAFGKLGRAAKGIEVGDKAARAAEAGLAGRRVLHAGEKTQQITTARSRVTKAVVEKPADVVSRKLPNVRIIGERQRVAKAAGREARKEKGRAQATVVTQAHMLPKKGSDESAAHFWWRNLPESEHNAGGLEKVKVGLQRELDRTLRGEPLSVQRKASKTLVAKRARVARLQKVYDKAKARSAQPEITRLHEFGGEKLVEAGPNRAMPTRGVFSRTESPRVQKIGAALSVAKDELAAAERRFASGGKPSKMAIASLPSQARNLALHIAQIDRAIAKGVVPDKRAMHALGQMEAEHTRLLEEAGMLEGVDKDRRRALVSTWLGLKEPGGYIGHRPGKIRGSGGLRSMGFGKAAKPPGVMQRNQLRLVRQGGVRADVHVQAEDLLAAHTYRDALRARKDLWEMGEPFEGHVPDGYKLVNPEGQVVPETMKTDLLDRIKDDPQALEKASKEMLQGYLSEGSRAQHVIEEARATGKLDKLRIIRESDAKRYYAQIIPAGQRNVGGVAYDKLIDATATSLIFARLGYIPKNILQNLVAAVPHQGVFFPMNLMRAAQLIPRPGASELDRKLWTLLSHESGAGVSGAIEQEATSKVLSSPAHITTAIADRVPRISAILHELAAEGVIPKLGFKLSEEDKRALLHALEDETQRGKLNDAVQRGVDAMGDFDRMTATQRRWARRFLIVPGWLMAGTRYPVHFALTHPGRSAALAYVAAGEPGAPDRFQVNKPIDEYLMKGLPSYIQAVDVGGGKGERVQSVLPGAIPFDIGLSAVQGAPLPTVASYANPLPEAASNIAHSVYETPSGETTKTSFMDSLTSNLQRLAPGEAFVQHEIAPGTDPSKVYPDKSRLGILARELGVVPVKIDREEAQRAQFSERGMKNSVRIVKSKKELYQKIAAAGEKPSKVLDDAYALTLERAKRLDALHGTGGLSYYRKAYKVDVQLALENKLISRDEAAATLAHAQDWDIDTLKKWHNWMGRHKLGGDTIADVRAYLRKQER